MRAPARGIVEAPLRRPGLVLGAVIVGLLAALAASQLVPRRYRASAHIRAQWITETGTDLSSIAAELAERGFRGVRQRVLALQERIEPTSAAVTVRPGGADDFFVECVHADPATAARVANRLASLLVEEAERERLEGAHSEALRARLADARREMERRADALAVPADRKDVSKAEKATERLERLAHAYERARVAYLELEAEWRAAEAAARSGRAGQSRFTVLQSASAPQKPSFPSPVLFALASVALGLLSGLGLAILVELRDPSVRGPEDLRELLPHTLLAEIPLVRVRGTGRRSAPTQLRRPPGRRG